MKPKNQKKNDDWRTPEYFYNELNEEFNFDFDPCPYQAKFDGLNCEWGNRNFINPPYSRKLKESFIRKVFEESKKGKLCVMLLPVSTSTVIFHEIIQPNAKEIRFIKGRLRFNESKGCGTFDSMIIVFDGRKNEK